MSDASSTTMFARSRASAEADFHISGFQRAGMLDWPGRVAATVFLGGCNLRCPFCHNPELATGSRRRETLDSLLGHIHERRDWLDGVVVTGGEPCLEPHLRELLLAIRDRGLPVKLDTNGTAPDVLRALLAEEMVDFVALDVKATPERYERATGVSGTWDSVAASIELIIEHDIDHEFRTTCYPPAVGPNDLVHIAARLCGARRYALQQFRPIRTLDPAAASVHPHSPETLRAAAARCSTFVPTVVRGA